METMPQSPHTNNEYWIEPVLSKSPVGETKIPDPIMVPTIRAMPLKRSTFFFNLTPLSSVWTEGFELDLSLGSFSEQPCCDPLPLVGLGMAKNRSFRFVIFWQNQGNLLKGIVDNSFITSGFDLKCKNFVRVWNQNQFFLYKKMALLQFLTILFPYRQIKLGN